MRNQVKLFINGLEVDLKEDLNILFTYQLEDRTNPTTIKNHYSKNITIEEVEGTPRNSLIFGLFSFADRRIGQGGTPGNQFDPSKRVPFELYVNADLQESGYAQLTKVTKSGRKVVYSITLYGGLGDFWYSLHMKEDGSTRTLADLKWNNRDENGNILPEEEEFDFTINKDTVMDAWSRLGAVQNRSEKQLFDTINFATLYPGTPDNFDADRMLINTNGTNAFPTEIQNEGSAYTTVNGFAMGELNKSYDCWAVRDIRSYLTKPVLSVRRFIETVCEPENNGGYNVDLDPEFFNQGNPYYFKAWMTLPSLIVDSDNSSSTYGGNVPSFITVAQGREAGTSPSQKADSYLHVVSASTPITISGDTLPTGPDGVIDLSSYPFSYLDAGVDFSLIAESSTRLPLSMTKQIITRTGLFNRKRYTHFFSNVFVQLVAFDAETNEKIGGSDIYRYCSNDTFGDDLFYRWIKLYFQILEKGNYDVSVLLGNDFVPGNIVDVPGYFEYDASLRAHKHVSTENYSKWRLSLERIPKHNRVVLKLVTSHLYGSDGYEAGGDYYNYFGLRLGYLNQNGCTYATKKVISYGGNVSLTVPNELSSGAKITKKKLLSTDESAADFLLSYSKMFGLYWYKDIYSNTIYCRTRNNFFTGKIENLDDRIDRSKDVITTPILFDKHFYTMTTKTPETKYSTRYQELYSRVYGSQKINTNFNFNNDTTELYSTSVFTNLIQARDTGTMYKTYYDKDGNRLPTQVIDGINYVLYSGFSHDASFTKELVPNDIDFTRTVDFYPRGGYDFMTHPCAFTDDGDSRGSVSNKYTLLFFDLFTEPTDAQGNRIKVYLTDDLNEMISLNGGRCWLWTDSAYDNDRNLIAYPLSSIPNFSRYYQNSLSWDFGTPQEYYVDDLSVTEDGSIYSRYWKKYLRDQFNANTRMMTCYVKFDRRIMEEALRKFYWFDNRLWVLNKVTDYSVTKYNTVKCEFIAIDDPNNYLNGQSLN